MRGTGKDRAYIVLIADLIIAKERYMILCDMRFIECRVVVELAVCVSAPPRDGDK